MLYDDLRCVCKHCQKAEKGKLLLKQTKPLNKMTKHLCDIDGNDFSVQIYLIHELLRTQEIMTFLSAWEKKKSF